METSEPWGDVACGVRHVWGNRAQAGAVRQVGSHPSGPGRTQGGLGWVEAARRGDLTCDSGSVSKRRPAELPPGLEVGMRKNRLKVYSYILF